MEFGFWAIYNDNILKKGVLYMLWYILLGLIALATISIILLPKISPDGFCRFFRSMQKKPESTSASRRDGVTVLKDISYESRYPNNQMDLYLAPKNKGTVFHIHGGGYVVGDKAGADAAPYLEQWVAEGFNVIRVNYALAPEYRYPTAIMQIFEAWCFLVKTAGQHGIDPAKTILMGNSAGAQLAGQLALILTDPAYAEQMGIAGEEIPNVRPLAFISTSGLLDMPRFGKTDSAVMNFIFEPMAVSTFDNKQYAASKEAKQSSILRNVTENFLPTFLSDGNTGTFTDQAKEMKAALQKLGVPVATHIPEFTDGKFGHDCELNTKTVLAQTVFTKQLAFVNNLLR